MKIVRCARTTKALWGDVSSRGQCRGLRRKGHSGQTGDEEEGGGGQAEALAYLQAVGGGGGPCPLSRGRRGDPGA